MDELLGLLTSLGIDAPRVLHGWARVMPVLVIVPAFGLSALPAAARGVLALCLAWICAPSAAVMGNQAAFSIAMEIVLGTSVALVASVPLWTATMVGSVADQWRGANDAQTLPFEVGGASLGALATLLAAWVFFSSGAPSEIVRALTFGAPLEGTADLARALSNAPRIAVGIALPMIATGCVIDIAGGFMARSAPMAPFTTLVSALKSTAVVFSFAIVLPRMFELIARAVSLRTT